MWSLYLPGVKDAAVAVAASGGGGDAGAAVVGGAVGCAGSGIADVVNDET